jgi:hypothetical protein
VGKRIRKLGNPVISLLQTTCLLVVLCLGIDWWLGRIAWSTPWSLDDLGENLVNAMATGHHFLNISTLRSGAPVFLRRRQGIGPAGNNEFSVSFLSIT